MHVATGKIEFLGLRQRDIAAPLRMDQSKAAVA
jgi:hypothetical protein